MNSTQGRSLGRRSTRRVAMLVATVLTVLTLAAPASAAQDDAGGWDWNEPTQTTTLGRSWS